MEDMKNYIVEKLTAILTENFKLDLTSEQIVAGIEVPKDTTKGDFAYPCFRLSKLMHKSPINIAEDIKSLIELDDKITKVEVVNGYLNFYVNSTAITALILNDILTQNENYGLNLNCNGKNVVIDYSSPNIAKPFHLGHLRTTVIGSTLYNLYKALGYNVIGINYLGDWGRQFGLLIEGYNRFKSDYDIENDPLHALSDIYVRISKLAKEDESIMEKARQNFKELESGNEEYLKLWSYFREVSLKEYNRIYELLGCKFDSYNGEAFYNDKMDEVVDILEEKGVLKVSDGAKVVYLGENKPPCIILKSNGSTIYATRDLAAILYRARTYNFDKAIYVTSYEQINHFQQVFEVAKNIVAEKYTKELVHVPYGMVRLKTGKMSTRDGNVIYLEDLINESIKKSKKIIEEKNANIANKEVLASQIGIGALIFNNLKHNKIKDIIFDLDEVLRFDGETGPYVQYTYVRTQSILKKAGFDINALQINSLNYELLNSQIELEIIKQLADFVENMSKAAYSYEPAIFVRYIIEVASLFSKYYNSTPVIIEDKALMEARCTLVYAVGIVIKRGLTILGIECPEQM